MPEGKVLFMDLDDTLSSDDKTVSPKNREAIRAALSRGHSVVVTTGRPLKSGKAVVKDLGLTAQGCYMIAFNGSVLYDCAADRILKEKTVPLNLVKTLFDAAKKAGIYIQTYDKEDVLAPQYTEELKFYTTHTGMTYRILPDTGNALQEEPYKALLISLESRRILEEFQKGQQSWCEGKLNSFFSSSNYLEYCPYGVDKGGAVLEFCEYFGIPLKQTVAVGDECNDVSMIKAAHIGVAVQNAVDVAKEAADYITKRDHNQAAVAEVIEMFL